MTYEEIDFRLSCLSPYALYVAITTGLNVRMDQDKMFKVGRHKIESFEDFISKDNPQGVDHYKYVRTTISDEIKKANDNIKRIKLVHNKHDYISEVNKKTSNQWYKRTRASVGEIIKGFLKTGKFYPYWYHYK